MKTERPPLAPTDRLASFVIPRHRRLSQAFTARIATESKLSATVLWLLSGWVGLVCGLAESGLHLAWRHFGPRVGDPDLWVNWNKPWLAPLSLAVYGVGFGMIASLVHSVLPRITTRIVPYLLIALGCRSALAVIPGMNSWAVFLLVAGLTYRLGKYTRFETTSFHNFVRATIPYLALCWLVLLVGTGVYPAIAERWTLATIPVPVKKAPNVLLVVLDTVRADSLSLHGYNRATSPKLAAWAKHGVHFEQARSTTSFTLGTHTSLFTGRYMSETSAGVSAPLGTEHRTLAEHLRDQGYATGGFLGNIFYGSAHYGLDRGFLRYRDIPDNILRRVTLREFFRSCKFGESFLTWFELRWKIFSPWQRLRFEAREVNREALAWVDETRESRRPFFLFVNYFDAHSPFQLPGDAPQPYAKQLPDVLEAKVKRLERLQSRLTSQSDSGQVAEVAELRLQVHSLLRDAYDDGITWVDQQLDELLQQLEQRGVLDDTLVVVTADHGEMLGEHNRIGHGNSLDRQVIHVPLIVIGTKAMEVPSGQTIKTPVSLRDVPATILGLLNDSLTNRFPGKSLSRYWSSKNGLEETSVAVLSEVEHMPWVPHNDRMPVAFGPMWVLTEGPWSYHRREHEKLGLQERLFNFGEDPQEEHDLAGDLAHHATLLKLRERFDQSTASLTICNPRRHVVHADADE